MKQGQEKKAHSCGIATPHPRTDRVAERMNVRIKMIQGDDRHWDYLSPLLTQ